MGKIYFMTTAYNAEKTLARCVDSVLGQTYRGADIVFYLCDNGSTDKTGDMIREYARKDARVRPFANRKNRVWDAECREYLEFRRELGDGDLLCFLDADDAYELTFLEEMVPFVTRNRLDVAACGYTALDAASNRTAYQRIAPAPVLFTTPKELAEGFPYYHQFMRPQWGKLFSGRAARGMYTIETEPEEVKRLAYGKDTFFVFSSLRHAKRVGIYPKSLHRYYVSKKSVSYQWNKDRPLSDRILYHDAIGFLTAFGPISPQNRNFVQQVYANAVTDTVNVIRNCDLSVSDKLREYRAIAAHPLTLAAYRECGHDDAVRSRKNLLLSVLQAGGALEGGSDEDLRAALQALSPRCGRAVSGAGLPLFLSEPGLLQALLRDDPEAASQILLRRMETGQGVKRFAIPEMLQALAAENPLLCQITDAAFLRQYARLYRMVWRGETLPALEEMTGLLLDGGVSGGKETFLRLYISLAAAEAQAPAFLFGKLQLAKLYLEQGRREECRAAVDELAEMGADGQELAGLRRGLEGDG